MALLPVNLAAVVEGDITHLYYVDKIGHINEFKTDEPDEALGTDYDGPNTVAIQNTPNAKPIPTEASPDNAILAATSYILNGSREIRIYYRSEENILREICHSGNKKYWYEGELSKKGYKLNPSSGLEAVVTDASKELKVYCVGVNEQVLSVWYAKWDGGGLWHRHPLKNANAPENAS